MFNPEKDDYPQNAAGKPEFASITIHLDPSLANTDTDEVVQKMVLATDTPIEALAKIAPHFGEPGLLASPKNAALLMQAGRATDPVFVYFTPREGHTLLILSTRTWDGLVQHPDFGDSSCLLASEKLQELAAKQAGQLQQFAGGFSNLILLDFSPSSPEDVGEQPASSQSDDGSQQEPQGAASHEGNAAESLRDTADIENV